MKTIITLFCCDFICIFDFNALYGYNPTDESEIVKLNSIRRNNIELLDLFLEMGFEQEIKCAILESKNYEQIKA